MQVDNFFHVGQAQAEALDVVYIASVNTIELIEYLLGVLALDAHTVVFDRETQAVALVPRADVDVELLIGLAILHRIVEQIGDGILEMHLVDVDGRVDCFQSLCISFRRYAPRAG